MSAQATLNWTPVKIGWISGVSRPGTRALSPEQRGFVEALPGAPDWKLRTNFPYGEPARAFRKTALPLASMVNLTHFLLASQPVRLPSRRRAWRALRESCDYLFLVTNSCGAQIVHALEAGAQPESALRVLSLGSVDWGAARLTRTRLRGSLDRVGIPGRGPAEIIVDGVGHLDYARSDEVRRLACEWVRSELQRVGHGIE